MKVWIPDHESRGVQRVATALKSWLPAGVTLASSERDADAVVIHVTGRRDAVLRACNVHHANGRKIALIQYVLRSGQKSKTQDWIGSPEPWRWGPWRFAHVVWSYYDLYRSAMDDGEVDLGWLREKFYFSPLGCDPAVFRPDDLLTQGGGYDPPVRDYLACCNGQGWLTESVKEVILAALWSAGKVWHLGPELNRPEDFFSVHGVSDDDLAALYRRTRFVSGLRRTEGFELPCVEGLLCGARPILFDQPHYRQWYSNVAIFLDETDRPGLVKQLLYVFKTYGDTTFHPVTPKERSEALRRFSWPVITSGFWSKLTGRYVTCPVQPTAAARSNSPSCS